MPDSWVDLTLVQADRGKQSRKETVYLHSKLIIIIIISSSFLIWNKIYFFTCIPKTMTQTLSGWHFSLQKIPQTRPVYSVVMILELLTIGFIQYGTTVFGFISITG